MPEQVELPHWLVVDFLNHFQKKVESLAKELSVDHEIYEDFVNSAHIGWLKELARVARDGFSDDHPHFWVFALGRLGVRLCRGRCVVFTSTSRPLPPRLAAYQHLILEFHEEYAALDFIRSLHMDLYYELRHNTRELRPHISSHCGAGLLHNIFGQLRTDPEVMSRYADLLNLPWTLA